MGSFLTIFIAQPCLLVEQWIVVSVLILGASSFLFQSRSKPSLLQTPQDDGSKKGPVQALQSQLHELKALKKAARQRRKEQKARIKRDIEQQYPGVSKSKLRALVSKPIQDEQLGSQRTPLL